MGFRPQQAPPSPGLGRREPALALAGLPALAPRDRPAPARRNLFPALAHPPAASPAAEEETFWICEVPPSGGRLNGRETTLRDSLDSTWGPLKLLAARVRLQRRRRGTKANRSVCAPLSRYPTLPWQRTPAGWLCPQPPGLVSSSCCHSATRDLGQRFARRAFLGEPGLAVGAGRSGCPDTYRRA